MHPYITNLSQYGSLKTSIFAMLSVKFLTIFAALHNIAIAQTTKVRYMPFGDSITEITCWRGLLYTQPRTVGYTTIDFVRSNNDQNSAGCATTKYNEGNEGHSGFQAVNIANQNQLVVWLQNNPADVITMHLRTNVVSLGQTTGAILTAFTKLIGQMRAGNPNIKIIVSYTYSAFEITYRLIILSRLLELSQSQTQERMLRLSTSMKLVRLGQKVSIRPQALFSSLISTPALMQQAISEMVYILTLLEMQRWPQNGIRLL
jgi:hypothetical protein